MSQSRTPLDWLLNIGAFLTFFGVYLLFFKAPAANEPQRWFRIGTLVTGIGLSTIALIAKSLSGNRRDRQ